MKQREVLVAVFAFGSWFPVVQGTFRKADGSYPVGNDNEVHTWLTVKSDNYVERIYARSDQIFGLKMELRPATQPDQTPA